MKRNKNPKATIVKQAEKEMAWSIMAYWEKHGPEIERALAHRKLPFLRPVFAAMNDQVAFNKKNRSRKSDRMKSQCLRAKK